jgi:serine/threonine protein kinase
MDHHALQPDHNLQEYRIIKLIGEGGFGLTYLAVDTHLNKQVAIKEYMPSGFAWRQDSTTIVPKNDGARDMYQWGLDAFMNEAKVLAKFDMLNIVRVYRFFEANDTVYLVMEYCEGGCLSDLLCSPVTPKKDDTVVTMRQSRVRFIIGAIKDGLQQVHDTGVLHRDIKPSNIMFRSDGTPVLIDFGAARQTLGEKSLTLTSIVTPGYAPLEQYSGKSKLGPWTDIYALAAVAYSCLTGKKPDEVTDRIHEDAIEVLANRDETSGFLKSIDWALAIKATDRPQTLSSWYEAWDKVPTIDKRTPPENAPTQQHVHKKSDEQLPSKPACIQLISAIHFFQD